MSYQPFEPSLSVQNLDSTRNLFNAHHSDPRGMRKFCL